MARRCFLCFSVSDKLFFPSPYRNVACVLHTYLLPSCTYHTCCICAAHKTHSFCMCAAYRIIDTALHVSHTQADEVCTHLSKVCTMVMCSMHAVAHVLQAYMLHMNNCTQSACKYSAHLMCLRGMFQFLCMQHICLICAAR